MLTVFPCYAREDRQTARDLSEFLEAGAGVQIFLDDGEIGAGETLLSKAADGLEAAVILLILSPDSAPARWARAEWEPVLVEQPRRAGVKLATVLARSCEFPGLLRREAFFDLTADRLSGFREIKRWLLGLERGHRAFGFEPARQRSFDDREIERLRRMLADTPGRAEIEGGNTTLAIEFARQAKRDFEDLVWMSCAGQSLAALAGEMSSQVGMTLEGDLETNVRELGRFCAQRRLLIVFDEAREETEWLVPGGRCSTLVVRPGADASSAGVMSLGEEQRKMLAAARACGNIPFRLPLVSEIAGLNAGTAATLVEDLVRRGVAIQLDDRYLIKGGTDTTFARAHAEAVCRIFANWAREGSECEMEAPQLRRALEWALSQEDDAAWALACDLAKRGVALMKRKGRQAEAFEILEAAAWGAEEREDRRMLEDCSREQIWILESWGKGGDARRIFERRRALYDDQMQFDFGALE